MPVTIAAASAQVFRNGAQAGLTKTIGTLGATQVRFIFGLPFALLFLLAALGLTGQSLPGITVLSLNWATLGAVCQVLGTALMLVVMNQRAFGVAYAYIKTEPVIVALLGVVPGLQEFVAELVSPRAMGEEGYLADKGLVPFPEAKLAEVAGKALALTPMN